MKLFSAKDRKERRSKIKSYVQFPSIESARAAFGISKDINFKCALCGSVHNFKNYTMYSRDIDDPGYCIYKTNWNNYFQVCDQPLISLVPEELEKCINSAVMRASERYLMYKTIKKLHIYRGNSYSYSFEIPEEHYVNFDNLTDAGKAALDTKFKCAMCGEIHTAYDISNYNDCLYYSKIGNRRANLKHLMLTLEAFIRFYIGKRAMNIYYSIGSLHHNNINILPSEYQAKYQELREKEEAKTKGGP